MKLKTIALSLIAILPLSGYSQIFTGGNVSAGFENDMYHIDAAPVVGYQLNQLKSGVSPFALVNISTSSKPAYSFGMRLFSQYDVYKGILIHAEGEAMNAPNGDSRSWMFGLPVGAGFEYEIMSKTKVQAMVLYDLLLDKNSPKKNPELRGGIVKSF